MKYLKTKAGLAALALSAGLLAGTLLHNPLAAGAASPAAALLSVPAAKPASSLFSAAVKQVEPSVVQITSTVERPAETALGRRGMMPFGNGEDPFGWFFGERPDNAPRPRLRGVAMGSGFVVDRNGYIMTNNHVVEGGKSIRVKLNGDGKQYPATLVGADPELDLAVLKINAGKPLAPVKLGNSDAVEVGDWSIAVGSPFGLEATVTAGIISAKGRDLGAQDHQLQRFLQTDAAINRGNSGGPLTNINGEVVGVNTMIATGSGNFEGVGFALPINLAVNSYNQIVKTGKVARGAIGIQFSREQSPELLKVYGATEGVFVQQVTPEGPAARAGLQPGDVIVAAGDKPVKDGEALLAVISQAPVGSRVTLKVMRDGKSLSLPVEIGDRNEIVNGNGRGTRPERDGGPAAPARLGLSVQATDDGLTVAAVEPGSLAENMGVQEGDTIVAVNRRPVRSAAELKRIIDGLKPGDPVALKLMRKSQPVFVAGTLPK